MMALSSAVWRHRIMLCVNPFTTCGRTITAPSMMHLLAVSYFSYSTCVFNILVKIAPRICSMMDNYISE